MNEEQHHSERIDGLRFTSPTHPTLIAYVFCSYKS
ncbi:hypothetical protein SAMN05216387_103252 [Nitrosovibrio tenuis]|uniref:Uncharacterized protein n=1 Tax=Nitrosovibrio tenuis TaxID=1233 RepID=A0A1H7KJM3_9PROT|nr:hypothetical protein SAMN05216387_103252 [Nitrosovibrio tenuis]